MFFSFDGIDGVGKSTQVRLFCDSLREGGHDFVMCRDPGSTPLGERIRELLLMDDPGTPIGVRSEMLLYMAARAQLVDEVIRPALQANRIVVADRFLLANVVYQGHAGGLNVGDLWQVGRIATGGVYPDCVFLLDMRPESADRRMNRPLDRMESQGQEHRRRLREGFLAEAARAENRIHIIEADRPVEKIQTEIWQIAGEMLAAGK